MPATFDAFEHFVKTGVIPAHIPSPRGETLMPKMSPYFTYEVGIDEPPHPDQDIAQRFVEVAMSDCKYGCKVYADPYSEVRVLVHSRIYGCKQTMAKLQEDRDDGEIRPGDKVEFTDFHDPLITHTGIVLNRVIPEEEGGREKFRVGCYYLVDLQDVRNADAGETYQQAYERLVGAGILNQEQFAAYLGITLESLKAMRLSSTWEKVVDGTEFKPYDWVTFEDLENPEITRVGQVMRYIPPKEAPEEYPDGGYHILYEVDGVPKYAVIHIRNELTLAERSN